MGKWRVHSLERRHWTNRVTLRQEDCFLGEFTSIEGGWRHLARRDAPFGDWQIYSTSAFFEPTDEDITEIIGLFEDAILAGEYFETDQRDRKAAA